jgi:hypothetical protein
VFVGETRSAGWHLTAGGHVVGPAPGFEWGMSFAVPASGGNSQLMAHLGYSAPFIVRAGYFIQIFLWCGAVVFMLLGARSLRRSADQWPATADPAWFAPMTPARPTGTTSPFVRRPRRESSNRSTRVRAPAATGPSDDFDDRDDYDDGGEWPDG